MICCCYHRPAPLLSGGLLLPVQAGRSGASFRLPMAGDDSGESLSGRNRFWCELTVLYWLRKNTADSPAGLLHYRRILNLRDRRTQVYGGRGLDASAFGYTADTVNRLLRTADIILPESEPLGFEADGSGRTLYSHYAHFHPIADLELALQALERLFPGTAAAARSILHTERRIYSGNLFIADRATFEAYADWLFPILFEVERTLQPHLPAREPYQQRVYGFLAERLLTVWLALHPEIRRLEVPILRISTNPFSCALKRLLSLFSRK